MPLINPGVLMIGWEYPPFNSGGLGVACQGLTKSLSSLGTKIYFTLPHSLVGQVSHMDLITCADPNDCNCGACNPCFSVYSTVKKRAKAVDPGLLSDNSSQLLESEIEDSVLNYADRVNQVAKNINNKYELIHAHDWMSFPAAIRAKKSTGKPFLAHIHSTEKDRIPNGNGNNMIAQIEKQGMEMADKIIAVSYYTKHILVRDYGIDESKIEVVHNGIETIERNDQNLAKFAPGRPVVVFMGRLTMQKGASYFLDLAQSVLQKLPQALFVLAGNGDEYHSLLLSTAGRQLSSLVLFTGFLRGEDREILLNRANVFVMPSLSEPFGLVALEAAQRNIPVIVSKNSGVSEVLNGAKVIDFWDINQMGQEIQKIVENKSYASEITAQQNSSLSKLSWENSAQKMNNLYRRIAAS